MPLHDQERIDEVIDQVRHVLARFQRGKDPAHLDSAITMLESLVPIDHSDEDQDEVRHPWVS